MASILHRGADESQGPSAMPDDVVLARLVTQVEAVIMFIALPRLYRRVGQFSGESHFDLRLLAEQDGADVGDDTFVPVSPRQIVICCQLAILAQSRSISYVTAEELSFVTALGVRGAAAQFHEAYEPGSADHSVALA